MEIPFRFQSGSGHNAFVMTFEYEQITANQDSDLARITIPARFKRVPPADDQQQELYPVVLELHGRLSRANVQPEWGATLLPPEDLPIILESPKSESYMNLSFAFSRHYLQFIEEQRASQAGQNILFALRLSGVAAIMKSRGNNTEPRTLAKPAMGEVVRYENVRTDFNSPPSIRIARSDWIDTLLPNLGYQRSLLVELPLVRTPAMPEAYQKAVEALDKARNAFNHEDYRGAMKYGREVLEHIAESTADKKISTWCKERLEPIIGKTKSQVIDGALNILRDLTSAASHANDFSVDRAIAFYVIETLALNLRYISSVLG